MTQSGHQVPLSKHSFEPIRCRFLSPGVDMRRREFIGLMGGAAAWPVVAQAQQSKLPVIGFLSSTAPNKFSNQFDAFHHGLKDAGFVEGFNVAVEYRWAGDHY